MKEKKKLTDEQKMILMYSGELLVFALVFIILGALKIVGTISYNPTRRLVFNYLTLLGALWGYVDFFWALFSPKRKAKSSMVDKSLTLLLATFMIIFDILCLVTSLITPELYNILLGAAIIYGGAMLIFEAIYHYFKPVPSLLLELEKIKEEEAKELEEQNKNENKEEETK